MIGKPGTETREPNLHRNNAAEWVMVGTLYPVRVAVRVLIAMGRWFAGRRPVD